MNKIVKITIPQGTLSALKLSQGLQGPPGATGAVGAKGDKGDARATITASATIPTSGSVVLAISPASFLNSGETAPGVATCSGVVNGVFGQLSRSGTTYTFTPTDYPASPCTVTANVNGFFVVTNTGIPGPQGIQGIQGVQGLQGIPGVAGATGPQGATGATGPQGATGLGFTNASVVGDNLVINRSDGVVINAGNVRGPAGAAPRNRIASISQSGTAYTASSGGFLALTYLSVSPADFLSPGEAVWGIMEGRPGSGTNGFTVSLYRANSGTIPGVPSGVYFIDSGVSGDPISISGSRLYFAFFS